MEEGVEQRRLFRDPEEDGRIIVSLAVTLH